MQQALSSELWSSRKSGSTSKRNQNFKPLGGVAIACGCIIQLPMQWLKRGESPNLHWLTGHSDCAAGGLGIASGDLIYSSCPQGLECVFQMGKGEFYLANKPLQCVMSMKRFQERNKGHIQTKHFKCQSHIPQHIKWALLCCTHTKK